MTKMTNQEIEQLIELYKNDVETKAFEYLEKVETKTLQEPFGYILEGGGKRIRPILTILGAGFVGVEHTEALDTAISMEILHNFTLVHDDIMDGSELRRGRPTIHKKWDVATGILAGDLMIGYACKLMPKKELPNIFKLQKTFNDALIEVCVGQAYDLEFNTREDITVEDYINMVYKKTSYLLFSSLKMGAYLGEPSQELIDNLENCGKYLGIAFQIQDDILDLISSNPKFGKTQGQDLVEGKKTVLIIRTHELAEGTDRSIIDKFYQNNGIIKNDIPEMLNLMEKLGVIEESKKLASEYMDKAYEALSNIQDCTSKRVLKYIMDSLLIRTY
ncbi:MAG: polyprenyl synthetase family protein [Candidatus Kapaibacteriales bacterium]